MGKSKGREWPTPFFRALALALSLLLLLLLFLPPTHNAHSVGWTAKRGTGTAALPVPVLLSHFQGGGYQQLSICQEEPAFQKLVFEIGTFPEVYR
ncbi:MAG: hypothetical protein DRJ14_02445 [Acidobacteria bacterium]|nr:MAG: hypothetical protein DRJ14_02445 [Acidobacteriota bacterium]